MNTRWLIGVTLVVGACFVTPNLAFGERVAIHKDRSPTPEAAQVTQVQAPPVIAGSPTPTDEGRFVSCGIVLDTTKSIYEGDPFSARVYCQNKTGREIVIRAMGVGGTSVYGLSRIWRSDGLYVGSAASPFDYFTSYVNNSCGSSIFLNPHYVKDNGYTIRIPAHSTVYFASLTIDKIGPVCLTLSPGDYLIEVELYTVETSGPIVHNIFMSAPVKIFDNLLRPPR